MGNTAFLSIVAPVGEPSAPPGSFSYSQIQLHDQASPPSVLSLWAVRALSLLGVSNMLRSIKMNPLPLMFAKPVLSSLPSLKAYYGIVPRTQLMSSRNLWKSTTASAVGCRNLFFLSICAQSEPVKCWRNNSYKLTSVKYFLFLFSSSPICSFLVLLFFWWW